MVDETLAERVEPTLEGQIVQVLASCETPSAASAGDQVLRYRRLISTVVLTV